MVFFWFEFSLLNFTYSIPTKLFSMPGNYQELSECLSTLFLAAPLAPPLPTTYGVLLL